MPRRKLSQADAEMIRVLHNGTGATITALAREYGVHADTVSRVVHGRTWQGKAAKPRADRKYEDWQVLEIRRLHEAFGSGARKICRVMDLPESDRGCVEQILLGQTYQDVR